MLVLPKTRSASNKGQKQNNQKDAKQIVQFLKTFFIVLCKAWYLSYLFPQMFLLNLKLHCTMTLM